MAPSDIEAGCGIAVQDLGGGDVKISTNLYSIIDATVGAPINGGLEVIPGGGEFPCPSIAVALDAAGGIEIDANGEVALKAQVLTWDASVTKVPDAAGTTVTTERPFFVNVHGVTLALVSALINVASSHVASDTANFTVTIRKRDAVGGAAVAIATYTSDVASGGVTAFVSKDLGALSNPTLPAGEILTYEITKLGVGATLSGLLISVKFTLPG